MIKRLNTPYYSVSATMRYQCSQHPYTRLWDEFPDDGPAGPINEWNIDELSHNGPRSMQTLLVLLPPPTNSPPT